MTDERIDEDETGTGASDEDRPEEPVIEPEPPDPLDAEDDE